MQPTIFTSIAGLASKRGIASTLSIALRTTLLRNAHTPRDERACETSLGGDGSSRLGGGGAMPQPLGGGRLRLAGGCRRHVLPQAAGGCQVTVLAPPSSSSESTCSLCTESTVISSARISKVPRSQKKLRRLLHNEFFLLLFTTQVPRFFWTWGSFV